MVKDSGTGMDEATLERIFDPFFTTKGHGGTGLGLSVVQGIVISHGGAIDVKSQLGVGTTFNVFLPLAIEDQETLLETKHEESLPSGNETILFVDDETDIAFMGKEMLERFGYTVIEKSDSSDALEEFRSNPEKYDIVITDYTMPKKNGLELASELKKIRPDIAIILTATSFPTSDISLRIKKPYSMDDLVKAAKDVMRRKQSV